MPKFIRSITAPPADKPPIAKMEDVPGVRAPALTDLNGVAQNLGVSTRYVQTLVRRKVIPVIRLGRRCTRFDLYSVLAAIRKFEIEEIGRRW